MHNIVANTSWISVVLILWGLLTSVIESNFISWFAFCFFLISGLFAWAIGQRK